MKEKFKITIPSLITKEIYGPRIVEQLQKESTIFDLMRNPNAPPYVRPIPERKCTIDNLKLNTSSDGDLDMDCNNCHNSEYLRYDEDTSIKSLIKRAKEFKHWEG